MQHAVVRILVSFFLALSQPFVAAAEQGDAVQRALTYLRSRADADGKIESYATSGWAALAFGAAGEDVGDSLRQYVATHHPSAEDPVTEWERQALALLALGMDPRSVDGRDYLAAIEGFVKGEQIGDPALLNDDMFGILALAGAGGPVPPVISQTAAFLLDHQNADGGWGFAIGMPSDVDLTGTMLQVMPLVAGTETSWSNAQHRALAFLKEIQNPDGGFPNGRGGPSNVASTAWVIRGGAAAGEDWEAWMPAVEYLLAAQKADGGFPWRPGQASSALMTSYAALALAPIPEAVRQSDPSQEAANIRRQTIASLLAGGIVIASAALVFFGRRQRTIREPP